MLYPIRFLTGKSRFFTLDPKLAKMSFINHILAVLLLALLLTTSAAVVGAKNIERGTVTTIIARLSLDKNAEVRLASDDFVTNGSDKYLVKNVPIRGADDSQDKELKRLATQGERERFFGASLIVCIYIKSTCWIPK